MYSLQHIRKRYKIIYVWKILESIVPNLAEVDGSGIIAFDHIRRGRLCFIPATRNTSYRNNRHSSIRIHGAKLFNIMPKELRNSKDCSVDLLKMKVDKFLQSIPDEPQIPGYTICRRAETNSLLDINHKDVTDSSYNFARKKSIRRGGHPWTPVSC